VIVTDNGSPSLSATQSFTVFVLETNSPPTLDPIANRVVHAGSLIQFTNSASDSDIPTNLLTFSLLPTAPPAANVNPTNGIFNWQTTDIDAGTTNNITVIVTDDGTPPLSTNRTFTATVVAKPVIQSIVASNTIITVTWSAISGQGYQLQTNTSLELPNWVGAGANVLASGPTASASDVLDNTTKYYRIRVLP